MHRMCFRMRHEEGFDLSDRIGEPYLFRSRERGHLDELAFTPEKTSAAGTEFIKHRVEQPRRRRNRTKGSKSDVHLVDAIELVGRAPGHQVSYPRCRTAAETNGYAGRSRFLIKLQLPGGVIEATKIEIVHASIDRGARNDQPEVISGAVGHYIKAMQLLGQGSFVVRIGLHRAHAPASELRCQGLTSFEVGVSDHDLFEVAGLGQVASRL